MSSKISEFKIKQYKGGLPHFGEIRLDIEVTESSFLEIIQKYSGKGYIGQGYEVVVSDEGFESWKKGIVEGISYAFGKLENSKGLKVSILKVTGFITDTNPTILGYAAARAILDNVENLESQAESKALQDLMFSSWDYDLDSLPNFEKGIIDGVKALKSKYKS